MIEQNTKGKSHHNIWYGIGRQRIEIPKSVLKSKVQNNLWLKQLYIASLGYYPKAEGHYTYRKNGLPENFLFYCVDGNGWYKIGSKEYKVRPNEFFILPQNIEHAYGSEAEHPWSIYWVHFGGNILPSFNTLQIVKKHFRPCYIRSNSEMISLFNKIYNTLEMGYSTNNLLFANMCLLHFISLFIYNTRFFTLPAHDKEDFIENAIIYMQEHMSKTFSLNELSQHFKYSSSRFSNLFKQKTGYAPIDYFSHMKMQKACQQLDFTDHSIKDIASNLGYDDPYYFSKKFSKLIGMSPSKYRLIKKD